MLDLSLENGCGRFGGKTTKATSPCENGKIFSQYAGLLFDTQPSAQVSFPGPVHTEFGPLLSRLLDGLFSTDGRGHTSHRGSEGNARDVQHSVLACYGVQTTAWHERSRISFGIAESNKFDRTGGVQMMSRKQDKPLAHQKTKPSTLSHRYCGDGSINEEKVK